MCSGANHQHKHLCLAANSGDVDRTTFRLKQLHHMTPLLGVTTKSNCVCRLYLMGHLKVFSKGCV
jgi:hypothetical protein